MKSLILVFMVLVSFGLNASGDYLAVVISGEDLKYLSDKDKALLFEIKSRAIINKKMMDRGLL